MKKAIFFAIVALLSFSSCKLDNGGYPIPNNGNVLLWRKVSSNIGQVDIYTRFFICADAVLYMDENTQNLVKQLWFNNYDITLEDGKVVFVEKNNKYSQVKYTVVTDGKKLSEGGVWRVDLDNIVTTTKHTLAEVTGAVGKEGVYIHPIKEESYEENRDFVTTVGYNINIEEQKVYFTYDSRGEINCKRNTYNIKFRTDAVYPLTITSDGYYMSGRVHIEYKDNITNKERKTTVVYQDGERDFI